MFPVFFPSLRGVDNCIHVHQFEIQNIPHCIIIILFHLALNKLHPLTEIISILHLNVCVCAHVCVPVNICEMYVFVLIYITRSLLISR